MLMMLCVLCMLYPLSVHISLCYVISSLFFMWLLVRHRTSLGEELDDDNVRVDVDVEGVDRDEDSCY